MLFSELSGMMAFDEDMMVVDRRGKEVLRHFGRSLDPYLRTAEVRFELATLEFYIHRQQTLHIAAHLYERIVALRQVAMDRHTDA